MQRHTIFLAFALLLGCNKLPTEGSTNLPAVDVAKENQTGVKIAREELIANNARWQEVWAEVVSTRSPKPPAPQVDFTQRQLVFVARGELGDACRSIAISRVDLRNDRLEVEVVDTRPPASCVCPPVTVQPVHVVSIPRAAANATYTYKSATIGQPCN